MNQKPSCSWSSHIKVRLASSLLTGIILLFYQLDAGLLRLLIFSSNLFVLQYQVVGFQMFLNLFGYDGYYQLGRQEIGSYWVQLSSCFSSREQFFLLSISARWFLWTKYSSSLEQVWRLCWSYVWSSSHEVRRCCQVINLFRLLLTMSPVIKSIGICGVFRLDLTFVIQVASASCSFGLSQCCPKTGCFLDQFDQNSYSISPSDRDSIAPSSACDCARNRVSLLCRPAAAWATHLH